MAQRVYTDEDRAARSAWMKAHWAKKHAESAQVKTDKEVEKIHSDTALEQLRSINIQIEESKEKLDRQLRFSVSAEKNLKERIDDLQSQLTVLESSFVQTQKAVETAKADIKERLAYKEQQEKEIHEVIEKGNDRLFEVDQEVKEILRKRDDLHQEIALLEERTGNLRKGCSIEEANLGELKDRYNGVASKYRAELISIRDAIDEEKDKAVEARAINAELQKKAEAVVGELILKSKELDSRENSLAARDAELTSRERLLKSRESR